MSCVVPVCELGRVRGFGGRSRFGRRGGSGRRKRGEGKGGAPGGLRWPPCSLPGWNTYTERSAIYVPLRTARSTSHVCLFAKPADVYIQSFGITDRMQGSSKPNLFEHLSISEMVAGARTPGRPGFAPGTPGHPGFAPGTPGAPPVIIRRVVAPPASLRDVMQSHDAARSMPRTVY